MSDEKCYIHGCPRLPTIIGKRPDDSEMLLCVYHARMITNHAIEMGDCVTHTDSNGATVEIIARKTN
jgi:hypothetical protein